MRLFLKSVFIENFIEFTVLYSWGQIVIIVYDIFWERHQPKNKLFCSKVKYLCISTFDRFISYG